MSDAPNSISTGEVLRRQAFELSCDEQYRLAFFIAENLGYVLTEEREHPDSPHGVAQRQPVPPEQESLTERLRTPLWAHSNAPFESPQLEKEENLAAMAQAADEIDRLRGIAYAPLNPEAILEILEDEIYCDRFEGTYDYGEAVSRIMALSIPSTYRVGKYRADYSPVSPEEIARPDPELDELFASSVPSTQRKTD